MPDGQTADALPDKHIAAARRRVAHLEALAAACDTANARIRDDDGLEHLNPCDLGCGA